MKCRWLIQSGKFRQRLTKFRPSMESDWRAGKKRIRKRVWLLVLISTAILRGVVAARENEYGWKGASCCGEEGIE